MESVAQRWWDARKRLVNRRRYPGAGCRKRELPACSECGSRDALAGTKQRGRSGRYLYRLWCRECGTPGKWVTREACESLGEPWLLDGVYGGDE